MQIPTTPFGAAHFALRIWLTAAAAPSPQITDASTSPSLHESELPLSWTRRIFAVPGMPGGP
jgi:hypothetical protein